MVMNEMRAGLVLLITLAMLPTTLIAFRYMVDQMAATAPQITSPIEEANFWARAFGA